MTPQLLSGLTSPDAPVHAVPVGTTRALCGVEVEATMSQPFPGGASSVCRDCLRAQAQASSFVPPGSFVHSRRAGGMG